MVTVVDAQRFLSDWNSEEDLAARKLALDTADERTVSHLLVEQVELADVLVLSKPDLVTPEELARLQGILRHLNPGAQLVTALRGQVPLSTILGTGRFNFERAAASAGWLAALRGERVPETVEYGITSFVYRARIPFHPARFWALLQDSAAWAGVLRSKGFFWLASRMGVTGIWSQAGGSASCEAGGMWLAALPREEWSDDPELRAQAEAAWQEPWGDRRQELVLIGVGLDEAGLRRRLDAALLTPAELSRGPARWAKLADPFPPWLDEEATGP
jgi:G3E family GTPase